MTITRHKCFEKHAERSINL